MITFKPPIRKIILECHIQRSWARTFFMCATCSQNNNFLLQNRPSCGWDWWIFRVKHGVKRP